jgi:glutamate racemase
LRRNFILRIGVFDSGVGGLTVLSALQAAMPNHSFLYLGDTARVPYGTRSPDTVIRYATAVAEALIERGAQVLVIACNTATTYALEHLREICDPLNIPVFGVIEPGVQAAINHHTVGAIAILGTIGTVNGGVYQRSIAAKCPDTAILAIPCPLFVPLAEEGITEGEIARLVAERYLAPIDDTVRTVILGCTHYPLLRETIAAVLPSVTLIDSAQATAQVVSQALLSSPTETDPSTQFFVTDEPSTFQTIGARFLGKAPKNTTWIDLNTLPKPTSGTPQ